MTYSKILKHFCSKCDEGTSHNIATQYLSTVHRPCISVYKLVSQFQLFIVL